MHSAGLKLTKLTYTRLEDNLIRHRGDRLRYDPAAQLQSSPPAAATYICMRVWLLLQ